MTQDPSPYDLLQDSRIEGIEELVHPYYQPPGDQEYSFPVVGQGVSSEMFQQISRAAGTGVYVQHDEETADAPYRLTGMPGGDAETNATNQMMLRTSSANGRSEAAIEGFFHTQLEYMPISFPAVSTTTTYYLCLTYDPRREEEPQGPIRIEVHTNDLPTTHGRKHIVLWTVRREPNQLLTQATITQTRPWLGHVINVWNHSQLPDPTTVEYGTLAVVAIPSRNLGQMPELYTNRGVHGWIKVSGPSDNEWASIGGRNSWVTGSAVVRHTPLGLQLAGYLNNPNSHSNLEDIGLLPSGYRPSSSFRGSAQVSVSTNPWRVNVGTNGYISLSRPGGVTGTPANVCLDGIIIPYQYD